MKTNRQIAGNYVRRDPEESAFFCSTIATLHPKEYGDFNSDLNESEKADLITGYYEQSRKDLPVLSEPVIRSVLLSFNGIHFPPGLIDMRGFLATTVSSTLMDDLMAAAERLGAEPDPDRNLTKDRTCILSLNAMHAKLSALTREQEIATMLAIRFWWTYRRMLDEEPISTDHSIDLAFDRFFLIEPLAVSLPKGK